MLGRLARITEFKLSIQDSILFSKLSYKFSLMEVRRVIDEDSTMTRIQLKINNRCRYKRVIILKGSRRYRMIPCGFNPFNVSSMKSTHDACMAMITDDRMLDYNIELIVDYITNDNTTIIKISMMFYSHYIIRRVLLEQIDVTMIDEDHYQGYIIYHVSEDVDKVDYFRYNDVIVRVDCNDTYIEASSDSVSVTYDRESNRIEDTTVDENHPVYKSLLIVVNRDRYRVDH